MNLLKQQSSADTPRTTPNTYTPTSPNRGIPTTPTSTHGQQQQQQQQHHQQLQQQQQQQTAQSTITNHLVTASAPLLMGGEHSAFRSLVPSAALLAASASLNLARQYTASTSPHPSESDEEINVHDDDSDIEMNSTPSVKINSNKIVSPLQLTTHDRHQ